MAVQEYKCPCCSGAMEFNPTVGKMKCPFCDTEFEMDTMKEFDAELSNETQDSLSWKADSCGEMSSEELNGMASYQCESCGAQIIADSTTTSMMCPYCDNKIVMMGAVKNAAKPEFIIPFKLDKKAAQEKFKAHLSGKKLLPSVFTSSYHLEEIKGVYVPYWLYNSDAVASMRFNCTKTRTFKEGDYECRETNYYSVFRSGSMSYENVCIDGSKKMDDALMDSVLPYKYDEGVNFQTAYMAGYLSDTYDLSAEECSGRANEQIKKSTERAFRNTVQNYDTVECVTNNVSLINGTSKYVLLPMWIMNTTWNGERYTFAMNGQTGKFVGNLPCDKNLKKKYFFSTAGIAAAVVMLISFIIYML